MAAGRRRRHEDRRVPRRLQPLARAPRHSFAHLRDDPLGRLRHRRRRSLGRGDARTQAPLQAHRLAQSADRPPTATSRARAACRRRCPISICSRRRTISTAWRRSNLIWRGYDQWAFSSRRLSVRPGAKPSRSPPSCARSSVTAAKAGAKALIAAGRLDRGGLDRRRLRPRRGGEGGAPMHGGRPVAAGLDRAERRARRTRRGGGRGARRRFLRQEFMPEPGHDGHLRRAGAAEPATADPRRFAGRGRARRGSRRRWASPSRSPRPPDEHERFEPGVQRLEGVAAPPKPASAPSSSSRPRASGDRAALKGAAAMDARYRAFVGSRRKAETLQARTRRGRRAGRGPRRDQGARRARHLRHLVGGDRAFDPRRNGRRAAASPSARRRKMRRDKQPQNQLQLGLDCAQQPVAHLAVVARKRDHEMHAPVT